MVRKRHLPLATSALILLALSTVSGQAQDTRTVTEPHVPATCAVLRATLSRQGDTLAPQDESRLDTPRIQDAIDSCSSGKAVALRRDGARNAFVSGPLELRRGVTLIIDTGVTLYGSRDARLYDKGSGHCGTVTKRDD